MARDPLSKGNSTPSPRPTSWPCTTPEIRERLGAELANALDGALYEHPELAEALLRPEAQGYMTNYVQGMRDAAAEGG